MPLHEDFLNKFDAHFKKGNLVSTSDDIVGPIGGRRRDWIERNFEYTPEEIDRIISDGDINSQILLSRRFYRRGGFYRNIINYYATLLKYSALVIPKVSPGKSLSDDYINKRYYAAVNYVEQFGLRDFFIQWALKALIDGTFYGIRSKVDKNTFSIITLPTSYCRTRYKDLNNRDVVEFNLTYFDSIIDNDMRKEALAAYPKFVSSAYNRWKKGKKNGHWIIIPAEFGICFVFLNGQPYFLNIIPEILDYNDTVDTEKERDEDEIKKIIVQKIPHLSDGLLLFEPDEAAAMHQASVNMMKGNKNVSVLTTYADVDAIVSRTSADSVTNTLERMLNNIYYNSGTSSEIFAARSNLTLETSLRKDLSMMMTLADKFSGFVTTVLNELFSNSNISFTYKIMPISYYNQKEVAESSLQMANSGYSFLLPALAMDMSQQQLKDVKALENELLDLKNFLIPLSTSYTQSGDGDAGRPTKEGEELSPKTEANQESIGRQGE